MHERPADDAHLDGAATIDMTIIDMTMSRNEAAALVQQLLDAAGRRDLARLVDLYAEDAVAVSPVFGELKGREQVAASWERLFSTFAEITIQVSDILVDADRIAVLSTIATTDRIGWFGLPATGSPIGYRLVLLLTTAGGKIVRDERIYDSAGVQERLEKSRIDKELRLAAEVQRALVPRTEHRSSFCVSVGDSMPCRAIGGDFFEFLDLPAGNVGIVMADVAGKGPAAALLAAMLQGMFASEASAGAGPAATLAGINERLAARTIESRFATLVYGVLSADGSLVYANAGHNFPALLTGGGIRRLTTGGPILGAFGDARFEEETIQLRGDDTLVFFTDGVTEARNAGDEEFGEDRLMACLEINGGAPAAILMKSIFAAVRGFCQRDDQSDDITVAVTRILARK